MKTLKHVNHAPPMVLSARTATDLMTPNPMSIGHRATVAEAAAFLTRRGIGAAPIIDEAGRPVGVVTRTDILQHAGARPVFAADAAPNGVTNPVTVLDIMTPGIFCVAPETAAEKVVEKMVALEVRRLFVVDADGILVGVVSAIDVLRKLRRWGFNATNTLAVENSHRVFDLQTAS